MRDYKPFLKLYFFKHMQTNQFSPFKAGFATHTCKVFFLCFKRSLNQKLTCSLYMMKTSLEYTVNP